MNEDIHEEAPGGLGSSTVDHGTDSMTPSVSAPSEPVSKCERASENDFRNPVQSLCDERDCDVEDVLQRTVESVVSNVQGTPDHSESAIPLTELNFPGATDLCSSIRDRVPQNSDNPQDIKTHGDGVNDEQLVVDDPYGVVTAADVDDDEDDFGDFGDFSNARTVDNSAVANGALELADTNVLTTDVSAVEDDNIIDDDDDFGDFEEADFEGDAPAAPACEFARFDASSLSPGENFPEEPVAPVSSESFRSLIAKLFAVVDRSSSDLLDRPVETGHFNSSVQRDLARCEDVDNWPCVLFRYDNSQTRKALLTSLCIDETPANCPRFAIDCLSNEFLQPVKESRGGSRSASGNGRELSEKAKEVLNKIPDLSFMKAEVLTFPTTVQAP